MIPDLIPDINSFTEFMYYYSVPGFLCARHAAGDILEEAQKDFEAYKERERTNTLYCEDGPPMIKTRTTFGFLGGFIFWPVIVGAIGGKKTLDSTPTGVWSALKYVFVKPPPKRIRKERNLAQLRQKSETLEKELELDD